MSQHSCDVATLNLDVLRPSFNVVVDVAALELWCCSLKLCHNLCRGDVVTLENSDLSISTDVSAMSRHCSNSNDTLHTMS